MSGRLFDSYLMVDWSAASRPTTGKDSIWIGHSRGGVTTVENIPTRAGAVERLVRLISDERAAGHRVLAGFDFPFGYPRGVAGRITGRPSALALWDWLEARLQDGTDNANNRFEVASAINHHYDGLGPCWGRPAAWNYPDVPTRGNDRSGDGHPPERRRADRDAKAMTVWQLAYSGAVGSQVLTGLPALNRLRRAPGIAADCAVWPFETGLATPSAPVVIAEIYPSLIAPDPAEAIKDAGQVRAVADWLARLDGAGGLGTLFDGPPDLAPAERRLIETEEAWILGLGHADALAEAA